MSKKHQHVILKTIFYIFSEDCGLNTDPETEGKKRHELGEYISDGYEIVCAVPISTANTAGIEYILRKIIYPKEKLDE